MNMKTIVALSLLTVLSLVVHVAQGQQPRETRAGLHNPVYRPVYRVAQAPTAPARAPVRAVAQREVGQQAAQQNAEHPLASVVAKAEALVASMDKNAKDYSATLVKRERVNGVLNDHQYIYTKIRHEQTNEGGEVTAPFSVYMNFLAPEDVKGREVIYIKGHNGGNLRAHDGGTGLIASIRAAVTVNLDPDSPRAMEGNKYPITDVGMKNLMNKLITVAKSDMQHQEVEVKSFENTKINGRVCTCLQSVHPVQRDHFRFHIARIYIDDELQMPIRYESYGWPTREGEAPPLLEEYTYLNVKLNNDFTDADFDSSNANYNFN